MLCCMSPTVHTFASGTPWASPEGAASFETMAICSGSVSWNSSSMMQWNCRRYRSTMEAFAGSESFSLQATSRSPSVNIVWPADLMASMCRLTTCANLTRLAASAEALRIAMRSDRSLYSSR